MAKLKKPPVGEWVKVTGTLHRAAFAFIQKMKDCPQREVAADGAKVLLKGRVLKTNHGMRNVITVNAFDIRYAKNGVQILRESHEYPVTVHIEMQSWSVLPRHEALAFAIGAK